MYKCIDKWHFGETLFNSITYVNKQYMIPFNSVFFRIFYKILKSLSNLGHCR